MKNNIIYFRYLTSYRAMYDPYFCLEYCRKIEKDSLEYVLKNVNAKMRDLRNRIMDYINKL